MKTKTSWWDEREKGWGILKDFDDCKQQHDKELKEILIELYKMPLSIRLEDLFTLSNQIDDLKKKIKEMLK